MWNISETKMLVTYSCKIIPVTIDHTLAVVLSCVCSWHSTILGRAATVCIHGAGIYPVEVCRYWLDCWHHRWTCARIDQNASAQGYCWSSKNRSYPLLREDTGELASWTTWWGCGRLADQFRGRLFRVFPPNPVLHSHVGRQLAKEKAGARVDTKSDRY